MDVTGLGAAYLDDFRMAGDVVSRNNAAGAADFAETLRRVAAAGSPASESDPQSPIPGPRSPKIDKTDKLYEQCVELEIFLVKNLISSMRNTVQKSGFIDEGFAGKIYEDMLYDEYARDYAKNANFGLAEMAYLELTGQRTAVR
jgi:flagellar protein FlgJ